MWRCGDFAFVPLLSAGLSDDDDDDDDLLEADLGDDDPEFVDFVADDLLLAEEWDEVLLLAADRDGADDESLANDFELLGVMGGGPEDDSACCDDEFWSDGEDPGLIGDVLVLWPDEVDIVTAGADDDDAREWLPFEWMFITLPLTGRNALGNLKKRSK